MLIWLTIAGMALATFLTRFTALVVLRGTLAPWLQRWLNYVPVAVFTALVVPQLVIATADARPVFAVGPALPAGIVGGLVAWRGGNVLLTIIAGLVVFWLLRWLGM